MDNGYLVIALGLSLLGNVVSFYVSLRADRRCREHERAETNAYHQLLRLTETKPPLPAGRTFVLTDAEMATRERRLQADSRSRARVLAADAHHSLTRTFRRG